MSAEVARAVAPDLDPHPAPPGDAGRFAAMFEAHAAHLFDYCYSMLGERQDAADATQATLMTAYSLTGRLQDASRLRAWLLALARRECLSKEPVRAALPRPASDPVWVGAGPVPAANAESSEPDTKEIPFTPTEAHAGTAAAALGAMPAPEREVLDLVYRHGVCPADLAPVLGSPADRATALLTAGIAEFERVDQGSAGVQRISSIPLLALPPSVWRRTISVVLDPELVSDREWLEASVGDLGPDGFPAPEQPALPPAKKILFASTLLAVLLLAPATAGAVVFSILTGAPQAVTHAISEALGRTAPSAAAASPVVGGPTPHVPNSTLFPKKRHTGGVLPILPKSPAPSPSPSSYKPHPSPAPTSKTPSPSPRPSSISTLPSPSPSSTPPSPSPSPSPTPPGPTPTGTP